MPREKKVSKSLCDERSGNILEKLNKIITNDLPHINDKLDKLEEKVIPLAVLEKIFWGAIGTGIGAIVVFLITGVIGG